jgi:hypothetical protein
MVVAYLSYIYLHSVKFFLESNPYITETRNVWDLYAFIFLPSKTLVSFMIFFSLLFSFYCVEDNKDGIFTKIRANNFFTWFTSKVISIFAFNFMLITISTLIVLIIGIITLGYGTNWSEFAHEFTMCSHFYSPLKFLMFNILTFTFFMTFICEVLAFMFNRFNKKIIFVFTIIYINIDMQIFSFKEGLFKVLKYFYLNSYLNFSNRTYYIGQGDYITIREGVLIPIFLMFLGYIIVILIYKMRLAKRDILCIKRNLKN